MNDNELFKEAKARGLDQVIKEDHDDLILEFARTVVGAVVHHDDELVISMSGPCYDSYRRSFMYGRVVHIQPNGPGDFAKVAGSLGKNIKSFGVIFNRLGARLGQKINLILEESSSLQRLPASRMIQRSDWTNAEIRRLVVYILRGTDMTHLQILWCELERTATAFNVIGFKPDDLDDIEFVEAFCLILIAIGKKQGHTMLRDTGMTDADVAKA